MTTNQKLQFLREKMQEEKVQACIIPTTDPHISEYTPDYWKTREWLSGFTGSAGTLVITQNQAGLWTDSRYFIQAEQQLKGTEIELFKSGLDDTPSYSLWLVDTLSPGDTVGIEGRVFEASEARSLQSFLAENRLNLNAGFDPYNELWENRPPLPQEKVFVLPESFSGNTSANKIEAVLNEIKKEGCNLTILAALDTIAWLFNLRGNDVEYNPVAIAYAVIAENETVLFIPAGKISSDTSDYLHEQGITIAGYEEIYDYIRRINPQFRILITPNKINYELYTAIPENSEIKELNVHPADKLKAIKNETEIAGIRNAMKKDGVALVKFLIWLEKTLSSGEKVSELDISDKLRFFRSKQEYYFSESFSTIAGYGSHGAIVHYEANEETNVPILPEGILLIDSGAQYFDGTTDITRTLATGPVTEEMKRDYTHVLKGNIQLAMAKFPKGTVGMQLDVLARQFLWNESQNFLHGTGHGVGHFLNVHEGPQSIRMNYNPAPLQPGMVTSDEPGLYKAGKYGIRIENLLLTIPYTTSDFGEFYAFETLTLCPIDTTLIDPALMSKEEIQWLNDYHRKVYEALSPFLQKEEKEWLREHTLNKE
jgi:Xaa-Pro aminopeptidase